MDEIYNYKYIKYKNKYLKLVGGAINIPSDITQHITHHIIQEDHKKFINYLFDKELIVIVNDIVRSLCTQDVVDLANSMITDQYSKLPLFYIAKIIYYLFILCALSNNIISLSTHLDDEEFRDIFIPKRNTKKNIKLLLTNLSTPGQLFLFVRNIKRLSLQQPLQQPFKVYCDKSIIQCDINICVFLYYIIIYNIYLIYTDIKPQTPSNASVPQLTAITMDMLILNEEQLINNIIYILTTANFVHTDKYNEYIGKLYIIIKQFITNSTDINKSFTDFIRNLHYRLDITVTDQLPFEMHEDANKFVTDLRVIIFIPSEEPSEEIKKYGVPGYFQELSVDVLFQNPLIIKRIIDAPRELRLSNKLLRIIRAAINAYKYMDNTLKITFTEININMNINEDYQYSYTLQGAKRTQPAQSTTTREIINMSIIPLTYIPSLNITKELSTTLLIKMIYKIYSFLFIEVKSLYTLLNINVFMNDTHFKYIDSMYTYIKDAIQHCELQYHTTMDDANTTQFKCNNPDLAYSYNIYMQLNNIFNLLKSQNDGQKEYNNVFKTYLFNQQKYMKLIELLLFSFYNAERQILTNLQKYFCFIYPCIIRIYIYILLIEIYNKLIYVNFNPKDTDTDTYTYTIFYEFVTNYKPNDIADTTNLIARELIRLYIQYNKIASLQKIVIELYITKFQLSSTLPKLRQSQMQPRGMPSSQKPSSQKLPTI